MKKPNDRKGAALVMALLLGAAFFLVRLKEA
jgi:hypothetical protein